ncbi:MAG: VCBS domain-containing protein [Planctomycetales bacterium]|nr:VCBS domain-containing protein [Planctomycetales bacterium]
MHLQVRSSRARIGFWGDDLQSNATLADNEWVHLTFKYSGGEQAIYINGILDATNTPSAGLIGDPTVILGDRPGNHGPFDGSIDNLKIFRRGLSSDEILQEYLGTFAADEADVSADFRLDEGSGSTIFDQSVNSRSANISGATWTTHSDVDWTVSGPTSASGTGSPIQFSPVDDGAHWVRLQGSSFPVLVANSSPIIDQLPTLSLANSGNGPNEGQQISLGSTTVTTDLRVPVLLDGSPVDELVVTDLGLADLANNIVQVSITDPQGSVTDLKQTALQFDDDVLELDSKVLDGQSNLTTAFWLKTSKSGNQAILSGANANGASEFLIELASSTELRVWTHGQMVTFSGLTDVADGVYRHFVVTRNVATGTAELFIDGVSQGERTLTDESPLAIDAGGLFVGQGQQTLGGAFDPALKLVGSLDELAIWGRVLNEKEIQSAMQGDIDARTSSLRMWLPMNEGTGEVLVDRGPLGLDATINRAQRYDQVVGANAPMLRLAMNEPSGSTILKNTGQLGSFHNATVSAGVFAGGEGVLNRGLDFSGGSHGMPLGQPVDPSGFANGESYSVEFFFKTQNAGLHQTLFAAHDAAATNHAVLIELQGGRLRFLHRLPFDVSGGTNLYTATTFQADQWYHIVAVNDSGTMKVFVDGVQDPVTESTSGQLDVPVTVTLGALLAGSTTRNLFGGMDEVSVYDFALTEADIRDRRDALQPRQTEWTADVPATLSNDFTLVDNGAYTLTVTTADGDGGFDAAETTFEVNNVAPTISTGASLLSISGGDFVGETFSYNSSAASDPGSNDTLTYLWEVTNDNGEPVKSDDSAKFSFVPQYPGHYEVWLTVTDSDGASSARTLMDTRTILPIVTIDQRIPANSELAPLPPVQGEVVQLGSSGSSPVAPAGLLRGTNQEVRREYSWTLQRDGNAVVLPIADQAELTFLPIETGSYTATLTIRDRFYAAGIETSSSVNSPVIHSSTIDFTVASAPDISISSPAVGLEGETLEFSLQGLPNLDDAATRSIEWFVDGVFVPGATTSTLQFTPENDGGYTISAEVTDSLHSTSFVREVVGVNVIVDNSRPTLVVDNILGSEGVAIELSGTYADLGVTDTHTVTIVWGDGSLNSEPTAAAGVFTASHEYAQDSLAQPGGVYTAIVTLTDSDGDVRIQHVSVQIDNTAPEADDDVVAGTDEATAVILAESELLGANNATGDTDIGSQDVLQVASVSAVSTLGASVTLNADRSITYDPSASLEIRALADGASTLDSFTYTIRDEAGAESTATVVVPLTGLNDAPVLADDSLSLLASDDTSGPLNVAINDLDVDTGTNLTLARVNGFNSSDVTGSFGTLAWQSDGTVSYQLDQQNAVVRAMRPSAVVSEVFTITINDGFVDVDSLLTITIAGVNDAPTAVDDAFNAAANIASNSDGVPLLSNDFDVDVGTNPDTSAPDVDQVRVVAVNNAEARVGVRFQLASGALLRVSSEGTYEYDPNGSFDYLPLGTSATDEFTYTIADEAGAESTATVTITIDGTNEAPTSVTLTGNTVPANASVNDIIGELFTTDVDQSDTHTYSNVRAFIGSTAVANSFGLSGSSLVLADPANLVADTTYFVQLTTTDANGLSLDQVFAVHVGPLPDIEAPVSSISTLDAVAIDLVIPITVGGSDPVGANGATPSGIREYQLWVAEDTGAFELFATLPANEPLTTEFVATSGHNYFFRSLAVDEAGNVESKTGFDTQTIVGDFDAPDTRVVSAVPNASGLVSVEVTGSDTGGGSLVFFDLYVSVDGGVAELIGSASAGAANGNGEFTALLNYQGRNDGLAHSYRFFSIGRDSASNIEAAPRRSQDVLVTGTFADAGLQATGIDVQAGAKQRSYIRELDILFNSEDGLTDLLAAGRVALESFALDADPAAPGTGSPVTDFTVEKVGTRLKLDFGLDGLTDNTFTGDGFYQVLVDVDGNGSFADAADAIFAFHRILGDANGDAIVDSADVDLINSQIGQSGSNLDGDVDGSQEVDGFDAALANFKNGVALAPWLKERLDD